MKLYAIAHNSIDHTTVQCIVNAVSHKQGIKKIQAIFDNYLYYMQIDSITVSNDMTIHMDSWIACHTIKVTGNRVNGAVMVKHAIDNEYTTPYTITINSEGISSNQSMIAGA